MAEKIAWVVVPKRGPAGLHDFGPSVPVPHHRLAVPYPIG